MNLDELRSAQSRERQSSSLQHLRDSFYEEAAEFIRGLRAERERVAERSEHSFPSDDPEIKRLTNEIDTAEEVVEALYERRVGKVVKKASFAAADMNVDDEGLTTEEAELFETLVGNIEANRASVLDALTGEAPTDSTPAASGDTPAAGAPTPDTGTAREADGTGRQPDAARSGDAPGAGAPTDAVDEDTTFRIGEEGPATAEDLTTGSAAADAGPAAPTAEGEGSNREGARAAPESSGQPDANPATHAEQGGNDAMNAASAMGGREGDADGDRHAVPPAEGPPGADTPPGTDTASGDSAPSTGNADAPPTDAGVPQAEPDAPPTGAEAEAGAGAGTASPSDPPAADPQRSPEPGTSGTGGADPGTASAARGGTGADQHASADGPSSSTPTGPQEPAAGGAGAARDPAPGAAGESATGAGADAADTAATPSGTEAETGEELTLVRITEDMGEIFGVDDRTYDLAAGDVVSLPAVNAAPLVDGGAAERLRPDLAGGSGTDE